MVCLVEIFPQNCAYFCIAVLLFSVFLCGGRHVRPCARLIYTLCVRLPSDTHNASSNVEVVQGDVSTAKSPGPINLLVVKIKHEIIHPQNLIHLYLSFLYHTNLPMEFNTLTECLI